MKITVKVYQAKAEEKRNLYFQFTQAEENDNIPLYFELKEKYEALEKEFDSMPTVAVSFSIGYRRYYQNVVKIGKTYFDRTTKMTASNGYRCIKEIPAITDAMRSDMIDDAHYY
tara:strand:+ start:9566 stop:9907 length:342 start_codon:yes stop_codon:yes gene_type:complete